MTRVPARETKKLGVRRGGGQVVSRLDVVVERGDRGAVDRNIAGLPELAAAHFHQREMPVDVMLVEGQGFADAHAGRREEAEQRRVSRRHQRVR